MNREHRSAPSEVIEAWKQWARQLKAAGIIIAIWLLLVVLAIVLVARAAKG